LHSDSKNKIIHKTQKDEIQEQKTTGDFWQNPAGRKSNSSLKTGAPF
jgi:hypothetical protein